MMAQLLHHIKESLSIKSRVVEQRIAKVEQETREVRHTLRNVQASSDSIARLILRMREDGSFEDKRVPKND